MKFKINILFISLLVSSCSGIFNRNSIEVTATKSIDLSQIRIEHGISATTVSRNNDRYIFENRDEYGIIYENQKSKKIFNEYGENDFLITYKDSFYLAFRQFKTNRRNYHSYRFAFSQELPSPIVSVKISGSNPFKLKSEMIPINQSFKYLGNSLLNNYYLTFEECSDNLKNFNFDQDKFTTKNSKLFKKKDDNSIHILTCNSEGKMYLRKIEVDLNFDTAEEIGSFWRDKENIFGHFETSDGDLLYTIEEADVSSFEPFGNTIYARDKHYVFSTRHGKIDNADVSTFRPIILKGQKSSIPVGKDKNNYFLWNNPVEDSIRFKSEMQIE